MMGRRRAVSKREDKGSKQRRMSAFNPKERDKVKDTMGETTGGVTAAEISKPEAPVYGEGIVHPLLIDHVIEKIFQHIICPKTDDEVSSASVVKNVKNLRLVCKQWKDAATRLYLRNGAPVTSFGNVPCLKSPDAKMQNFLDVMKNSDLIPIQRYTIQPFFLVKENEQLMKDFMRICGPNAVALDIHSINDRTMKFSRRSFPDLNLKNLKSLTFECEDDIEAIRSPHEITYLIEVLLSATETLQEFHFYEYNRLEGIWPQVIVQRFGESITKRLPKAIKKLGLLMPLNDLHLITLAESGLKLEELHLYAQCGASSMAIRNFLENQAATLKYLRILDRDVDGYRYLPVVSFDFPRFHELLRMDLDGGIAQEFSFSETFPKLTTLNIKMWKAQSTCVEFLTSAKNGLSLKEIHLPYRFAQAPLVKKVAECFPNITKLFISQSRDISKTLQEVFVNLPNVEELYVEFPYPLWPTGVNADSVFTGISELDCRRIKNHLNFDSVDMKDVQHQPSLLNLTKLKKLVLEDRGDVILTDLLAHFVLLKMDSLKELHTHQFQMSSKYVGLLQEKLKLKLFNH